jgi:hypothetical protein
LTEIGNYLPLEGSKQNNFLLHPNAQTKAQGDGGLYLHDHKGEIIAALKELLGKLAKSTM